MDGDDWVNPSLRFPVDSLSPATPRESEDNPVESESLWGEHPMVAEICFEFLFVLRKHDHRVGTDTDASRTG